MATQIRRDLLKDWSILIVDDEQDSLEVARLVPPANAAGAPAVWHAASAEL